MQKLRVDPKEAARGLAISLLICVALFVVVVLLRQTSHDTTGFPFPYNMLFICAPFCAPFVRKEHLLPPYMGEKSQKREV